MKVDINTTDLASKEDDFECYKLTNSVDIYIGDFCLRMTPRQAKTLFREMKRIFPD